MHYNRASAAILRAKFSFVCGVLLNVFAQCPESGDILIKVLIYIIHNIFYSKSH